MTLDECTPQTRVRCPGGICGKIEKISTRPNARYPILVARDDGSVRAYAPSELTVLEQPRGHTLRPLP